MGELSGDLGMWAKIRIPIVNSSEELHDIRGDLIFVDSQFAEWLAGGRQTEGKEFEWLQVETSRLLGRIDGCQPSVSDADQVAALRGYVERMKRIIAGDDTALLA